ncbi:MAG: hypothetical protein BA863_18840 [Desulfovibrio sp. S3730MH75]|nr:MAG: hypothetical protein BA863_18840 [Desulfovibrio sp. S3730MH75]
MKWEKLGVFFKPDNSIEWMHSHAAVPFIDKINDDLYRLFFTSRTKDNVSTVGNLLFDSDLNIVKVNPNPVITPGGLGMYDEQGVTASYCLDVKDKKYLYFVGWNQGKTTPFRNAIGIAISEDGGETFQKFSNGPIVDRSPVDPCFVAGTCVMYEQNMFKMWYISCVKWEMVDGKPRHYYHLKYATSPDGINWQRDGIVAIDFKSEHEYAVSQPWVIKENGLYKMWFSYRAQPGIPSYRIGYADSSDGISWDRRDEDGGIDVSTSGWDSEMICYPYIYDIKGQRYMFYNGNNYGETGIGIAKLVD